MNQPDNLHRLNERAEVDLKLIRSMMQRTAYAVPVPGWGISAIGLIGVIAAYVMHFLQGIYWVAGWGIAAVVAVSLALLISSLHIRNTGKSIYIGGYIRFWLHLLPAFISAGLLSWLFIGLDQFQYLPAVWLLLYGVAVTSAGSHSIPHVRWMGVAFLPVGLLAVFFPTQDIAMGLGFGGIHLLFGILIARTNRDETGEN